MAFSRKFRRNGNFYYQHDDRCSKSFHKKTKYQRDLDNINKLHKYIVNADDVDMTINVKKHSKLKFTPLFSRLTRMNISKAGSSYIRDVDKGRNILGGPWYWFKVTLYHGKAYERQDIIKKLQNYIRPLLLMPIGMRLEGDNITFFVDNKKVSEALNGANFKLKMRDGCLMQIKVESKLPVIEMNATLKDKIASVMSSHYDDTTEYLDLSQFYANDEFLKQDLFVPLNRANITLGVLQIIDDNVPKLTSLNLSNNKISTLQHFSMLKNHANELKSLNLSKNRITNLKELTFLEGLKLDSLVLESNPLCNRLRDPTIYVREVRKLFPTLLFLDGVALSSVSLHHQEKNPTCLPETTNTTTSQPNPSNNFDGKEFTRQFLELFYSVYDNPAGDRSPLNEAYALTAQFSLISSYFSGVNSNKFITEQRNSIRVNNHIEGKTEILLIGKQNIVRFLSTLPKTQHDSSSFRIDLSVFTPELVSLRVTGVYREAEYNSAPIKAFDRDFTLISTGSGFNIVKDVLCITDASTEQVTSAFGSHLASDKQVLDVSDQLKTSLCLEGSALNAVTSAPPAQSVSENSQKKQNMVAALAKQTGMNLLWSKKCLDETDWKFEQALHVFNEFHKVNAIPAEAFV